MKMYLAAGAPLLLAALLGCAEAAGETKSGPQVGDNCVPLSP